MSVVSETNINRICRTCVSTSTNLKPLFQTGSSPTRTSFAQLLMALTPVKCYENDGLPTQICGNCISDLLHFERFQQQCVDSVALLRKQFHQPIKTELFEDTKNISIKTENIESEASPTNDEQLTSKQSPKTPLLAPDLQFESNQPLNITKHAFNDLETTNSLALNKSSLNSEETLPDVESNMSPHLDTYSSPLNYTYDTNGAFTLEPNILQNMREHTSALTSSSNKPHICAVCHCAFRSKYKLTRHLLTHSTKAHKCKTCNRVFATQSSLEAHMRTILNELYACAVCHIVYEHKHTLKIHMRKHTGEKPYACSMCKETFRLKGRLKKHMRKHIAPKRYCTLCGKPFWGKKCSKRHRNAKAVVLKVET